MKKINLEELKEIEFNILCIFDVICKKYQLRYSLDFGTLLGAVRHQGFIPWDDDIDVMMPKEDYEKLITIADEAFADTTCRFFSYGRTKNYVHTIAKLIDVRTQLVENKVLDKYNTLGVCIDIFPMDLLPEDTNIRDKLISKSKHLYVCSEYARMKSTKSNNFFKNSFKQIGLSYYHIIGPERYLTKLNKMLENSYNKNENTVYRNLVMPDRACFNNYNIGYLNVEEFNSPTYLKFENQSFPCIKSYKKYLNEIYGNYMELPPLEDRIPHDTLVYWKDNR